MADEKEPKVPAHVRRVVDRCASGERLMKTYPKGEAGEIAYRFMPSAVLAPKASAEEAIRLGLLVPNGDGLFGDKTSQTWRAA